MKKKILSWETKITERWIIQIFSNVSFCFRQIKHVTRIQCWTFIIWHAMVLSARYNFFFLIKGVFQRYIKFFKKVIVIIHLYPMVSYVFFPNFLYRCSKPISSQSPKYGNYNFFQTFQHVLESHSSLPIFASLRLKLFNQ